MSVRSAAVSSRDRSIRFELVNLLDQVQKVRVLGIVLRQCKDDSIQLF